MTINSVALVLLVGLAIVQCREIKYEDCDQDSDSATLDARMKVFGFMVPIPGVEKDLCKYAIQCPVVKGNTYHGSIDVYVPTLIPSVS
ncbi:hypothetical protein HPB52_011566 [Rhipicephalus sanguineus]|uniref:MD-2-related lipid-recognition domain-containing protein n=1 Tax=Rhipicephalus sanguineus TaxID=34632 RepID=A0A9D4PVU9_RHISA|nr:hypothetical protein HPB52_011566 [Rhipicephalus sanguineus]